MNVKSQFRINTEYAPSLWIDPHAFVKLTITILVGINPPPLNLHNPITHSTAGFQIRLQLRLCYWRESLRVDHTNPNRKKVQTDLTCGTIKGKKNCLAHKPVTSIECYFFKLTEKKTSMVSFVVSFFFVKKKAICIVGWCAFFPSGSGSGCQLPPLHSFSWDLWSHQNSQLCLGNFLILIQSSFFSFFFCLVGRDWAIYF